MTDFLEILARFALHLDGNLTTVRYCQDWFSGEGMNNIPRYVFFFCSFTTQTTQCVFPFVKKGIQGLKIENYHL